MTDNAPKLYDELAGWWPLLSHPSEYAEEAAVYLELLLDWARKPGTMLELGCGGGNNASHLKASFNLTLTDTSEPMLDVSRRLNPECEHVRGDMRTLRLGRQFDAVFVHDAIAYITAESDLRAVLETAFVHCDPGGRALFVPDDFAETFAPSTRHGGHDGDGRALRYLEWIWDPNPADATFTADFVYLLREGEGAVRTVADRHVMGAFPRATWDGLLAEVGFETEHITHQTTDGEVLRMILCTRPG